MRCASLSTVLAPAFLASLASVAAAHVALAQAAPRHPPVCSKGVRTYADAKEVNAPYDTLTMPAAEPVQVTNDEEAEAADLAMRGRAGSVGATGVIISDVTDNVGGRMAIHRRVVAVFVRSDSARAQKACSP